MASTSASSSASPTSELSEFSTCELSDALIKLGVPHGGYIPDVHSMNEQSARSTLCGPAYTVKMVWSGSQEEKFVLEEGKHWVDTAEKGSVVVVNAPANAKNAVWGGLMSAGAIAQGALGVVISGRIRDLDEHTSPPQDRPFPVFARGHSTLGQAPFTRVSALNVPVTIAPVPTNPDVKEDGEIAFPSVTVNPGDYVVADKDGVVCVPREMWEVVVQKAKKGKEVDGKCLESIKNGEGVGASFKKWRGK